MFTNAKDLIFHHVQIWDKYGINIHNYALYQHKYALYQKFYEVRGKSDHMSTKGGVGKLGAFCDLLLITKNEN